VWVSTYRHSGSLVVVGVSELLHHGLIIHSRIAL
jgi:hypothetical protein